MSIAEYLNDHGAPLEEIQQTVQDVREANETNAWASAVDAFLQSPAGATWEGGSRNMELIGMTLMNLGLQNADDKVAALSQAYAVLKEKGMLFMPETQAAAELADLQHKMAGASHQDIRELLEDYKQGVAAQGGDPNTAFVKTFSRSGQDTKYDPTRPSGEKSGGGFFGHH